MRHIFHIEEKELGTPSNSTMFRCRVKMKRIISLACVSFIILLFFSLPVLAICEGDFDCDGDVDGSDLAVFAANFGTTGCGTCDDVIGLIQALESRIADLENKTPKGFNARLLMAINDIAQSETRIPVATLTLPPGDYIMTLSMGATYFYQGTFNPAYETYVDCVCVGPGGSEIGGCGLSESVAGSKTFTVTFGQWTNDDLPSITLQCKHNSMEGSDTMDINHLSWTAIRVDELDIQAQ